MEFFKEVVASHIDVSELKQLLSIKNLPQLCDSITSVINDNKVSGTIYCLWGEFDINREELKEGIRFSMLHCPNAFAWTITLDDAVGRVTLHCTINKKEHEPDFVESIEDFLLDWEKGLSQSLEKQP